MMKELIDFPAIKSYVRRENRITPGQSRAFTNLWPKYGLSLEDYFINHSPECILEIGFGMGRSLLNMAMCHPLKQFIGIEVHRPGVGALLLNIEKYQLKNIQIYNSDAVFVLNQCIADKSLSKIQIFFPDPWPKLRHQKRRLIQYEFTQLMYQKLKPGGLLHLATDWQEYAEQMRQVAGKIPGLVDCSLEDDLRDQNLCPITKFEQKAKLQGSSIWNLLFRKDILL